MKDYRFELDKSDGGSLAVPLNGIGGLGIEVDEDMLKKFHVPLVHKGVIWIDFKSRLSASILSLELNSISNIDVNICIGY